MRAFMLPQDKCVEKIRSDASAQGDIASQYLFAGLNAQAMPRKGRLDALILKSLAGKEFCVCVVE